MEMKISQAHNRGWHGFFIDLCYITCNVIALCSEVFSGAAVETDQDIGEQIGDSGLYIPGYLTALVGHGLKAPG